MSRVSVEGFVERLYARTHRHYVQVLMLFAGLWLNAFGVVHLWVISVFYGASLDEYLDLLVWVMVGLQVAGAASAALLLKVMAPVLRWQRGEQTAETAAESWDSGVARLPRAVAAITVIVCVCCIPAELRVGHLLELSAFSVLMAGIFVSVMTLGGAVLVYLLLEQAVRPLVRDLVRLLPADFEPRRPTPSLATKLLGLLIAINLYTAMLMAAFSDTSLTGDARIGLAVVISLTLPLALALLLRRLVVLRLRDLRDAFRRVGEGDLDTFLPNLAGDEIDEVGGSFNEMVAGLRERERLQDDLRASRARIVAAADASRRAVERDLHDGAQQHLVLLKLKLGMLERRLAEDPETAGVVADVKAQLDRALAELRDLARGIYPSSLTNDGLRPAIEEVAERLGPDVTVECSAERFPAEKEAAVYFCCVEALQNAAKHAGEGAEVRVSVDRLDGELRFEVTDDGPGFDPASRNGSSGLQNMADRLGALGGGLTIESRPGAGTRVTGRLPV